MTTKVHYGWEEHYPESNESSDWGTACGLESFDKFTGDWNKVTCKRCLKRAPQNTTEENGHVAQQAQP